MKIKRKTPTKKIRKKKPKKQKAVMHKSVIEKGLEDLCKDRDNRFGVVIHPAEPCLYLDEKVLKVSHNGVQWMPVSLNPIEADKVVESLVHAFNLPWKSCKPGQGDGDS